MNRGNLKYITIAVEPGLHKFLKRVSFENNITVTKLFRMAVKDFLGVKTDYEKDQEDLEIKIKKLAKPIAS